MAVRGGALMHRRRFLAIVLTGLLLWTGGSISLAVEQLDLTTPETFSAPSSITYWRIDELHLYRSDAKVIIGLVGTNGEKRTYTFTDSLAMTYINALNKRNASTTSNNEWTLDQLKTKGYLTGTIS